MKKPPNSALPLSYDSIVPGELMLVRELCRRLGWQRKTLSHAKQVGLKTIRFGRFDYCLSSDVIAFFSRLADKQHQREGAGDVD
jgi:hypothetical protein